MTLHQHLVKTHEALVKFYNRPECAHMREEIAETIALLQQSIELEKEKERSAAA